MGRVLDAGNGEKGRGGARELLLLGLDGKEGEGEGVRSKGRGFPSLRRHGRAAGCQGNMDTWRGAAERGAGVTVALSTKRRPTGPVFFPSLCFC